VPTRPTDPADGAQRPLAVSVVMPVRNEEHHLAESVGSVLAQDYAGEIEVVLAVAPSQDATEQVAEALARGDARVVVVGNPGGRTPEGLNLALARARHPVVARVDGHGALPADYLSTAVEVLQRTGAANVGGVALPEGRTPMQRAIATAMGSPLGMGGARFRVGGAEGEAETVFPGVFRREWIDRVGGFDPSYDRAQDWELNLRIRQAGGVVWFTPALRVTYRPRSGLRELARQFYSTGQWRRRLAREHQGALGPRFLAPPLTVMAVTLGAVGATAYRPLVALPLGYAAAVALGGWWIARHEPVAVRVRVPAALATMHLSWGTGFLVGLRGRSGAPAPSWPAPRPR
jgi:succinoglycan biosynthesis protein ExoA